MDLQVCLSLVYDLNEKSWVEFIVEDKSKISISGFFD